jgi:hypothetical protein
MDICLWGLDRDGWPAAVSSSGGKYQWKDDQETPNTLQSSFDFGDALMTFDVRNLPTPPEGLAVALRPNYVGNIFFGPAGFMVVDQGGFQVYKSTAANISGEAARGAGAGQQEKYEKVMDEKAQRGEETNTHMQNLFEAMRARDHKLLRADVEIGARSAAFCHLANISYRVGHGLRMDRASGRFAGDAKANALLTRDYRKPYAITDRV